MTATFSAAAAEGFWTTGRMIHAARTHYRLRRIFKSFFAVRKHRAFVTSVLRRVYGVTSKTLLNVISFYWKSSSGWGGDQIDGPTNVHVPDMSSLFRSTSCTDYFMNTTRITLLPFMNIDEAVKVYRDNRNFNTVPSPPPRRSNKWPIITPRERLLF